MSNNGRDMFSDAHPTLDDFSQDEVLNGDDTIPVAPPPESSERSKEIYHRLKPYINDVINQLKTSFDAYVVPIDLTHKLAEAYSITGSSDIYANDMLVIFSRLRPLITKKLDITWVDFTSLLKKRISDIRRASRSLYTLENIAPGQWFHPDKNCNPTSNFMDIAHAIRQLPYCSIRFDEWEETVHFKYGNHDEINDIDEIRSCLSEYIHDHFRLLSKDEHLEKAVRILLRRAANRFDSRLLFIDQFRGPSDPNFKPIAIMGQVLCCDDTVYNREVARQLNLLMVERSLRPGRSLQRLPTLYSRQHTHKTTLCKLLAGNTDFNGEQWYTPRNILAIDNDVTRYSYVKGKAIVELAERQFGRINLEHLKAFIDMTIDVRRPLFKNDSKERARWYGMIATTNEYEYNIDIENRRDFGIEVGTGNRVINTDLFLKHRYDFFNFAINEIESGRSSAPDIGIMMDAKIEQEKRPEKTDLMGFIDWVFALAQLHKGIMPQLVLDRIFERYQVGFKDETDRRIYGISLTGLSNFAADYRRFSDRKEVKIENKFLKTEIRKVRIYPYENDQTISFKWERIDDINNKKPMRFPQVRNAIRGYALVIDAPHVSHIDVLGSEYLLRENEFTDFLIKDK